MFRNIQFALLHCDKKYIFVALGRITPSNTQDTVRECYGSAISQRLGQHIFIQSESGIFRKAYRISSPSALIDGSAACQYNLSAKYSGKESQSVVFLIKNTLVAPLYLLRMRSICSSQALTPKQTKAYQCNTIIYNPCHLSYFYCD